MKIETVFCLLGFESVFGVREKCKRNDKKLITKKNKKNKKNEEEQEKRKSLDRKRRKQSSGSYEFIGFIIFTHR